MTFDDHISSLVNMYLEEHSIDDESLEYDLEELLGEAVDDLLSSAVRRYLQEEPVLRQAVREAIKSQ